MSVLKQAEQARAGQMTAGERAAARLLGRWCPDTPALYKRLRIVMDDVLIELRAPGPAAAFVEERYPLADGAPAGMPDMEVTLALSPQPRPLEGVGGRRVLKADGAVWCRGVPGLPNLTIGVREGPPVGLYLELARAPLYRLYKRLATGTTPERIHEILVAYAVLYPALLSAEWRGRYPLHAAAVAREGRVVLLLGLPGAGKSTISAALESRGFELVSDNLVTVSADGVWPVPEPLKLDELGQQLSGTPVGDLPSTYGRSAQPIAPPHGPLALAAVVMLQPGYTTALHSDGGFSPMRLLDLNALAFEIHAYQHFGAIVRLALPEHVLRSPQEILADTLAGTRTALVTVGRGQVDETCDLLEGLL